MSRTFRGAVLPLTLAALTSGVVSVAKPLSIQNAAQPPASQTIDVQSLGPKVGEMVPDFSLLDQHGRQRSLRSLMGSKGVMLVFFRSADW